ncbi:Phosphatidylglycerophosphatase A [hydrothermal vent metagenome]|uniref:Phosphatidylglycerophosphatase A n=1 Tax=hydrothermal vent metagenome TaxID=652676 RepID=A0A3B1CK83_9ZZZZ
MKINAFERTLGSGFYTGYIPFASGTFGSLFALAIYLIPGFENPTILLTLISLFSIIGIYVGSKFEKVYGKDPPQCTIDEFVGMWITLLFVPKYIWYIVFAFIIWRILDIVKPFPVNILEKIKGGWGIMLDDIVAGLYSLILVHIIIYFIN